MALTVSSYTVSRDDIITTKTETINCCLTGQFFHANRYRADGGLMHNYQTCLLMLLQSS